MSEKKPMCSRRPFNTFDAHLQKEFIASSFLIFKGTSTDGAMAYISEDTIASLSRCY